MKNKKIAIVTSALSIASAGLLAVNIADNSSVNYPYLLRSMSEANSVSIIRSSGFDGDFTGISSVTATTEKGNSLEFGANHFDVRNKGTQWNDCLVFCVNKGQSTLWNKTELYGITSIKIYSYNSADPDSYANLCTASFTFYYGYELIDFSDTYHVAKQTNSSGKIEFAAGYEPSFFGIECHAASDLCVSKIEVNYQCEKVSGELVTYSEAQGYNPQGKVFEYTNGNSVVTREVEMAPLAREYLALENRVGAWYNTISPETASYYEPSTHSWTTTRDDYLQIRRSDDSAFSARTGRDTVLITLKVSKAEGFTGWSGNSDIYLRVNHGKTGEITNRIALNNPYNTDSWAARASRFEIYDAETGKPVTGNWWDRKVTIEFSVASTDTIYNVGLGTSNAYQKFTMYDISFRDDCSQHEYLDNASTGYSFGHKCHRCLKYTDQLVDQLEYRNFSGLSSDNFTYETGVSFGGFNNCLKTTANIRTNTAEGGYPQNYQLRLKGLIANARAAGLTYIRFKGYVQSASNFNSRFSWGFATGTTINSWLIIDHYNGPYDSYKEGSYGKDAVVSVTKLDGSHAGASGGQTNSAYANQWFIMTLNVSDAYFEGKELFFSPAHTFDEGTYPMHVYVADLECLSSL